MSLAVGSDYLTDGIVLTDSTSRTFMTTPGSPGTAAARFSPMIALLSAVLTLTLWLYPHALEWIPIRSAIQLITLFWASIAALAVSAVRIRRQTKSSLVMLLIAVLLLLRPGSTAVTFSLWMVRGFAP